MASILTIDDTRLTHHVVRLMLGSEGHSLASARDGVEGLEMARRLSPAVVILGRTLPALDAPEVLSRLRERDPRVRAIVIGAGMSEETRLRFGALGATAFLDRPIDGPRLRAEIESALGGVVERSAA